MFSTFTTFAFRTTTATRKLISRLAEKAFQRAEDLELAGMHAHDDRQLANRCQQIETTAHEIKGQLATTTSATATAENHHDDSENGSCPHCHEPFGSDGWCYTCNPDEPADDDRDTLPPYVEPINPTAEDLDAMLAGLDDEPADDQPHTYKVYFADGGTEIVTVRPGQSVSTVEGTRGHRELCVRTERIDPELIR